MLAESEGVFMCQIANIVGKSCGKKVVIIVII